MRRNMSRMTQVVIVAALVCASGEPVSSAITAPAEPTARHAPVVEHADVDGDGIADRIVLTPRPGYDYSGGRGRYVVRVTLSSDGATLTRTLQAQGFLAAQGPWNPWFGAASLVPRRGVDLLLGESTGASSFFLFALRDRDGHLRLLRSPQGVKTHGRGSSEWNTNSDADVGNGVRCTARGVEVRGFFEHGDKHHVYETSTERYLFRHDRWTKVHHRHRTIRTQRFGGPRRIERYGSIDCPGVRDTD